MDSFSHPLAQFLFCPKCGSATFRVRDAKSKKCDTCGFVYYFNPSAATAVFITDRERLLVAVRGKEPAKGTYDLPGGFVDLRESSEQAARREIREEVGPEVEQHALRPLQYLFSLPNVYTYCGFQVHTVDVFYLLTLHDVRPFAGQGFDDVESLEAISYSDLSPSLFGLPSIRKGVTLFLDQWISSDCSL